MVGLSCVASPHWNKKMEDHGLLPCTQETRRSDGVGGTIERVENIIIVNVIGCK